MRNALNAVKATTIIRSALPHYRHGASLWRTSSSIILKNARKSIFFAIFQCRSNRHPCKSGEKCIFVLENYGNKKYQPQAKALHIIRSENRVYPYDAVWQAGFIPLHDDRIWTDRTSTDVPGWAARNCSSEWLVTVTVYIEYTYTHRPIIPDNRRPHILCSRDAREWLFTFPLPPIPVQSIPIPSHSHSRTLHRCSINYFGLGKTQA